MKAFLAQFSTLAVVGTGIAIAVFAALWVTFFPALGLLYLLGWLR